MNIQNLSDFKAVMRRLPAEEQDRICAMIFVVYWLKYGGPMPWGVLITGSLALCEMSINRVIRRAPAWLRLIW